MDTRAVKTQLRTAREVLEAKGAPLEGTAAGHLILALEELTGQLDNQFGYSHRDGEIDKVLQQHRLYGGARGGGKTNMLRDMVTNALLNGTPVEEVPPIRHKGILRNADS